MDNFRKAESGILGSEPQIRYHRQFKTAAQGVSIDRREQRHGKSGVHAENGVPNDHPTRDNLWIEHREKVQNRPNIERAIAFSDKRISARTVSSSPIRETIEASPSDISRSMVSSTSGQTRWIVTIPSACVRLIFSVGEADTLLPALEGVGSAWRQAFVFDWIGCAV